jgi:hypothetical protein
MDEYPRLARALLDAGESPASIAAFLTVDYGLDHDQAKAAIVLGPHARRRQRTTTGDDSVVAAGESSALNVHRARLPSEYVVALVRRSTIVVVVVATFLRGSWVGLPRWKH